MIEITGIRRRGPRFDRRQFLVGGAALVAAAMSRSASLYGSPRTPRFSSNPFTLGVASGDPLPESVVLWTRLAPNPLDGGGMPEENVEVEWSLATDEHMRHVIRKGRSIAMPELGHSVHPVVEGLEPSRWYWYRFRAGNYASPIARTRTAPAYGASIDGLRFAFASCQHYETGYYTAFRHMAAEDLDIVFHLGDYIYEGPGIEGRVRKHSSPEITSLYDYRNRHAQYRSDPDLQAVHHNFPWAVTWDDHEVDNNYAAGISEKLDDPDIFLPRRAAAYRAYYEHMPLRLTSMPHGPDMQLYRKLTFGTLAEFAILDTRQFRTDQPCGDGTKPLCPGVADPAATLLGAAQQEWLFDLLDRSQARWNLLAQQVMMAWVDRSPGPEQTYSMDQWSGYDAARNSLLGFLGERKPSNPVVLTGDIHTNWVNNLKADFRDMNSPTVATEFVGTSISSSGDGSDKSATTDGMLRENPFVKFQNANRGYVSCELTPQLCRAQYRVVDYVSRRGAPLKTRASFVVENGKPGAEWA